MRQRVPVVLSTAALVVAVLGSTPLGHAAGNVVRAVVPPFAKTSGYAKVAGNSTLLNGRKSAYSGAPGTIPVVGKNGKLPAAIGAIGAIGPAGPQGTKGDPGLSGMHLVQASVNANTPIGEDTQEVVSCPQGETATGGGGIVQQFNTSGFVGLLPLYGVQALLNGYVITAGPVSDTGHITVNAWVICAKVAS
jgi:hypothetical protein